MTKKEKELAQAFPYLEGKEVNIWLQNSGKEPFAWGKVKKWTGSYLVFETFQFWNGRIYYDYMLNSRTIKKIECRKEKKSS